MPDRDPAPPRIWFPNAHRPRAMFDNPHEAVESAGEIARARRLTPGPASARTIMLRGILADVERAIRACLDDGRQDWREEIGAWFAARRAVRAMVRDAAAQVEIRGMD